MERIESIEDDKRGVVTYRLDDGRWVTFERRFVQEEGLRSAFRSYGIEQEMPTERVPVMQYGRRVGTLPPDFDPYFAQSKSFLYDYRPGDLKREGNAWVASRTLGGGDLDCLVGFVRERPHGQSDQG